MSLKANSTAQNIELHEARMSELRKEESRLRATVESQQILASDVKLMNSQKEQMQRSIDKTVAQIEKVNKESWDQEVLIQKAQDQISGHRQELLRLSPRISELNTIFGLSGKISHGPLHIPIDHYMKPDSLQSLEDLVNFIVGSAYFLLHQMKSLRSYSNLSTSARMKFLIPSKKRHGL